MNSIRNTVSKAMIVMGMSLLAVSSAVPMQAATHTALNQMDMIKGVNVLRDANKAATKGYIESDKGTKMTVTSITKGANGKYMMNISFENPKGLPANTTHAMFVSMVKFMYQGKKCVMSPRGGQLIPVTRVNNNKVTVTVEGQGTEVTDDNQIKKMDIDMTQFNGKTVSLMGGMVYFFNLKECHSKNLVEEIKKVTKVEKVSSTDAGHTEEWCGELDTKPNYFLKPQGLGIELCNGKEKSCILDSAGFIDGKLHMAFSGKDKVMIEIIDGSGVIYPHVYNAIGQNGMAYYVYDVPNMETLSKCKIRCFDDAKCLREEKDKDLTDCADLKLIVK